MSLLQEGIDDEAGFIAFCAHLGKRHVVRGAQLLQAFNELYAQGRIRYVTRDDSETNAEHNTRIGYIEGILNIGTIKCSLVERVDKDSGKTLETPFTATETLLLAAHYNSKNGRIRPMTMLDNITLAQRFIMCRLRDLNLSDHLDSSHRRSVPPNIVWSKLPQFVSEATACNLIPFSFSASTTSHFDLGDDSTADPAVLKQQTRTIRQRQAEYLRLGMSLLWSPHTQNLIMNRYNSDKTVLSCSLWSIRTFRLRPFTSADDTEQFVMLLAMYRCQHERRSLGLRPFDREKTKQFLELIEECIRKLLAWTLNLTKAPFPTKWDIFNAVTTVTVVTPPDSDAQAPEKASSPPQEEEEKRTTIASILMSLLTRWDHNARGESNSRNTSDETCSRDQILHSLQFFMQRWPFARKWRFLSQSLPCFQTKLFLQPLLPLQSVRIVSIPTQVPSPNPVHDNSLTMATPPCTTVAVAASASIERPPRPVKVPRVSPLLPAAGDNDILAPVPLGISQQAGRQVFDPITMKNLCRMKEIPPPKNPFPGVVVPRGHTSQPPEVLNQRETRMEGMSSLVDNLDANSNDSLNSRASNDMGVVIEEVVESGQGNSIVDGSEDGEDEGRNSDGNNSTNTDPVARVESLSRSIPSDASRTRTLVQPEALKRKRGECVEARNGTLTEILPRQSRRKRDNRKKKKKKRRTEPIVQTATVEKNTACDRGEEENEGRDNTEQGSDESDGNEGSDDDLEPFYDTISAKLPSPTGVENLPTPCHNLGAWRHYVTSDDVTELTELMKQRCAAMYYLKQHGMDQRKENFWPSSIGHKAYCNFRNIELHNDGYTILEGVLQNTVVGQDADDVITHFSKLWKGENCTAGKRENSVWQHIFNIGSAKDPRYARKGVGRYSVCVRHLVDIAAERHREIFRKRLRVETALGILIDDIVQDTNSEFPLRFPVTGSRLLFHTRHAPPQLPHYDFGYVQYKEGSSPWRPDNNDLSYFAMLSGAEGFHLRVWRDGHRLMYGPYELVGEIAETLQSELLHIPPYSILIVRGDLPHAGAGGQEADNAAGPMSQTDAMHIRFHVYAARHFQRLKNGVYVAHHKFKINDSPLPQNCSI